MISSSSDGAFVTRSVHPVRTGYFSDAIRSESLEGLGRQAADRPRLTVDDRDRINDVPTPVCQSVTNPPGRHTLRTPTGPRTDSAQVVAVRTAVTESYNEREQ